MKIEASGELERGSQVSRRFFDLHPTLPLTLDAVSFATLIGGQ